MNRILSLLLSCCLLAGVARAQSAPDSLPYQRFPGLPPLQLLLGDSTTLLTKDKLPKKKPTLVLYFSTGCSHCQHTTEQLVKYKDSLPDMNLVMATFASISEMNDFRARYHTDSLPHTYIGKDINFLLPPFYGIQNLPFMAFYDRKGQLVTVFEGSMGIPQVLDRIRQLEGNRK